MSRDAQLQIEWVKVRQMRFAERLDRLDESRTSCGSLVFAGGAPCYVPVTQKKPRASPFRLIVSVGRVGWYPDASLHRRGMCLLRGFPITLKGEMLVELGQRVKTLEYEMRILKNEIQKTLLDIQEQVLIHYYPALRTEESSLRKVPCKRSKRSGPGRPSQKRLIRQLQKRSLWMRRIEAQSGSFKRRRLLPPVARSAVGGRVALRGGDGVYQPGD
jgi:hypothetical protein